MSPRPLATITEVAEYLNLNVKTLRNWAKSGHGPRPRMVGREYRYVWAEVEAYVESRKVEPVDEPTPETCGCIGT